LWGGGGGKFQDKYECQLHLNSNDSIPFEIIFNCTTIMNNEDSQHDEPGAETTLAVTEYARTARALNDVNNALRKCGADKLFSLPIIAVIGNQSVGKSSLIEAISQIEVPRSTGTCTRCPMEVILRREPTTDWTCKVAIPSKNTASGQALFKMTSNKKDVESILRRAQLAVLNPSKPQDFFLNLDDDECKKFDYVLGNEPHSGDSERNEEYLVREDEWKEFTSDQNFSDDSVVVEITGAEVDVTFIDLPGLIKNNKVSEINGKCINKLRIRI
jgi:hypothetical protein